MPRMVRGRPSGLKAARAPLRGGLRPALTPEPPRPLGGRNQRPGPKSLPPGTCTAPAASWPRIW